MPSQSDILRAVPDVPRHAEIRALVMRGLCSVFGSPDDGLVLVGKDFYLSAVIGAPSVQVLREAARAMPKRVELLTGHEHAPHVRHALPEWREMPATLHEPGQPTALLPQTEHAGVVLFESVDDAVRAQFTSEELHRAVEHAGAIAAKSVDGRFVSICYTNFTTETLWDVGVDTLSEHRRRGYARQCFEVLAGHFAARNRLPVWGALDSNDASLEMARSLGFVPADHISIFMRPKM